jgi:hypothetical protein
MRSSRRAKWSAALKVARHIEALPAEAVPSGSPAEIVRRKKAIPATVNRRRLH